LKSELTETGGLPVCT